MPEEGHPESTIMGLLADLALPYADLADKCMPIFDEAGTEAREREEADEDVKSRMALRRKHTSRRKEQGYQEDVEGRINTVEVEEEEL